MKGPLELRRYLDLLRRLKGKRNGVIPGYAFDDLLIFKLQGNDRRNDKRQREPREEQFRFWICELSGPSVEWGVFLFTCKTVKMRGRNWVLLICGIMRGINSDGPIAVIKRSHMKYTSSIIP